MTASGDAAQDPWVQELALRVRNFPVEELEVHAQIIRRLKAAGIETYGDLVTKTEDELSALPGIGPGFVQLIKQALDWQDLELGIQLPDDRPDQEGET